MVRSSGRNSVDEWFKPLTMDGLLALKKELGLPKRLPGIYVAPEQHDQFKQWIIDIGITVAGAGSPWDMPIYIIDENHYPQQGDYVFTGNTFVKYEKPTLLGFDILRGEKLPKMQL